MRAYKRWLNRIYGKDSPRFRKIKMEITVTSIHHYPGKTIINAVIDNLPHILEISVVKGNLLVTGNDNIVLANAILEAEYDPTQASE